MINHAIVYPDLCHHMVLLGHSELTHWGRVTHICVSKLTIIGSDKGLSPRRCQAIIWTNGGLSLIGPLGTKPSEILTFIQENAFERVVCELAAILSRPQCVNVSAVLVQLPLTNLHYSGGIEDVWFDGIPIGLWNFVEGENNNHGILSRLVESRVIYNMV